MQPVVTGADLAKARSQGRAFLFLWVDWAIHARHSEIEVRRLIDLWKNNNSELEASAYRIGVSEQHGEMWDALFHWLSSEPEAKGNLMYGGGGALLWMRAGTVVASFAHAAELGHEKMLAITRDVFA